MTDTAAQLFHPKMIRERCGMIYAAAERNALTHFELRLPVLDVAADRVIEVTRRDYPTLDVPYHSRWRHFGVAGIDRAAIMNKALADRSAAERARSQFELAIVSVLLDAGAGMQWRYRDAASGTELSKSEGLAVASFDLFRAGAFSSDARDPWRADAKGLACLGESKLAAGFQVGGSNPLTGVSGRLGLLHRLGEAITTAPEIFGAGSGVANGGGTSPRLGGLFDHLAKQAVQGRMPARSILAGVLQALGSIWPGRILLDGVNLGDVWRHPIAGLVPFHKLSQWLTYSLVEPLEDAGIVVTDLDELTGLPEYRNGGLFLDLGVLVPKHAAVTEAAHKPEDEVIVEWRALTVILLDRVADLVRIGLGKTPLEMPLAKVLQGGTWTAGREIARGLRTDGGPPLKVVSDGTVF